jgi:signal peptidase II
MFTRKHLWAGGIVLAILSLDLATKSWALDALDGGRTIPLLGGLVPLTLAFNRGAAFSFSIGDDPRWLFVPVTIAAVVFLVVLIRQAEERDRARVGAAAAVLGGALGNLYDRIRWDRGVVDFIGPIDLGFMFWPVFNVADAAITCGAIALAWSFWREEVRIRRGREVATANGGD